MSDKRSTIVFTHLQEAEQKFDYFVTGLTGALCAFVAEKYAANKLGLNQSSFELLAFIVLIASFYYGFRRIQLSIHLRRLNLFYLNAGEKRGALVTSFQGNPTIDECSGEILTPEDMLSLIKKYTNDSESISDALPPAQREALRVYDLRNVLLFLGFILLVTAKLVAAYL